jgi:hypothetical protein
MSATANQLLIGPGASSEWLRRKAASFLRLHEDIDHTTQDSATEQIELARRNEAPSSEWLAGIWRATGDSNREAEWNGLPEAVADLIEEGAAFVEGDLNFLLHVATNPRHGAARTDSAIRLLGILAEDSVPVRERALPVLLDSLAHPHPRVRYRAAQALWTAGLTGNQERIARAVAHESDDQVRATLEHLLSLSR